MPTRINVAVCTSTGLVRKRNEDAFLVADILGGAPDLQSGAARLTVGERGALLAVSDGMGGHKAGDVASSMTVDRLYRALVDQPSEPTTDERLVQATEAANAEVYAAGRRPSLAEMGATLTAVLVDNGTAYVAEVGDSRGYVIRDGAIHRLTTDQSLAQLAVSAGALQPEEAEQSTLKHVLAQAIGHGLNLSVALSVLELRRRDCLVLASDGLTGKVSDEEIARVVLGAGSLSAACETLVALANERGGEDNITVLLAGISDGVPEVSQGEHFSGTFRVMRPFDPRPGHAEVGAAAAKASR